MKRKNIPGHARGAKGKSRKTSGNGNWMDYTTEHRIKAVQAVRKAGVSLAEFAATWGFP